MRNFLARLVTGLGLLCVGVSAAWAEAPYVVEWSRQLGTSSRDYSNGTAVDAAGNVLISGPTWGSLAAPNAGSSDVFLAKYNDLGGLSWSRQLGTSAEDWCGDVAVDATGNAFISGFTFGSLGGAHAGGHDAFLTKYDTAGSLLWARQLGTSGNDLVYGLAVDATGNALITGPTSGSLGGPTAGGTDAFLAKYDADGNQLWARQFGGTMYDSSNGVAVDATGNAFVAGHTNGALDGANAGSYDAFLTKYDSAGNLLWTKQLGTSSLDVGWAVAVDAVGNAFLSGSTKGTLDGANAGVEDAFLAKYDAAGNPLWTRQLGTVAADESYSVAVDAAGNAFISGYTFGALAGPNAGEQDVFLAKYDSVGNLLWTEQLGTSGSDIVGDNPMVIDAAGNVFISGLTSGSLGGPNAGNSDAFLIKLSPVPEPGTVPLMILGGLTGLMCWRRKKLL